MRIEQFDPQTDCRRLRACHQIMETARPVDHPSLPPLSPEGFTTWWAHGGGRQESWLASDDAGEPVGCYLLVLPEHENTTMAECGLVVTPARRRAGAGRALLVHCADRARLAGRSRLTSTGATRTKAREGSPGAAFAAAVGATAGQVELIMVQEIDSDLLVQLTRLLDRAERRSFGYELVSWFGGCPDEHVDQFLRVSDAMSDAPRDAGVQPQRWNAARLRDVEALAIGHGLCLYSTAARHRDTGEFAAVTRITTDPGIPGWGIQQITAVLPAHRGHGLGIAVKIAMLQLLTEHDPGIRRILTGTAESNQHMIAINVQLGYQISDTYRSWELDLATGPPT
jgi:GNAT superfamily N-acetyltransferase